MSKPSPFGRPRAARWLRVLAAVAATSGMLLTVGAPSVLAAPRPLTISLTLGDSCVTGEARKNSFVKVVVRDPSGNLKLRDVSDTGAYGEWQVCGYSSAISSGDRVKATVFETGQMRQFTVPKLTVDSDRVSETVSGKAPAGSSITIELSSYGAGSVGLPEYEVSQSVVAAGNGTYSHDFSTDGIDLFAGVTTNVSWHSAGGAVQVNRAATVAGLQVGIGQAQFLGYFKPNAHLGIVVRHNGSKVATGDAIADPFYGGQISGQFVDADAEPYAIRPGDVIKAPGLGADGTFTVPAINGAANLSTEQVSGTCFANGIYAVVVVGPDYYDFGFAFGTAAANGKFTADLGDQLNIRKNFTVEIGCYTANADLVLETFVTH